MQTRTYVVRMPGVEAPTTPLDILVENAPGSQDAPEGDADNGAYYEVLGRSLRIPNPAGTTGYVPRLRLGCTISIVPLAAAVSANLPGVQLSASLASFASTDSGPTIDVPAFADPSGGPAIRLIGSAATQNLYFLVTLSVVMPADVDRAGSGIS